MSLKNRIRFTSTISIELQKQLKDYSTKSMIPISKIIEVALTEYITKESTK